MYVDTESRYGWMKSNVIYTQSMYNLWMKPGIKVVKGPDWMWGNPDGPGSKEKIVHKNKMGGFRKYDIKRATLCNHIKLPFFSFL